jgi:hypothetical protein
MSRIRPVIQAAQSGGGWPSRSWFPAAFRPPAFASRSSVSRRGIGRSLRSAYRTTVRTSTGFPRSTRTSCDRGGCLLYPGDGRCSSRLGDLPSQRLPLHRGKSLHPAQATHQAGLPITRHQRRFTQFTRPVCPSPVTRRMERHGPWAFPRASHPTSQRPVTHVGAGPGHRARAWNYALNITSVDPPIRVAHS